MRHHVLKVKVPHGILEILAKRGVPSGRGGLRGWLRSPIPRRALLAYAYLALGPRARPANARAALKAFETTCLALLLDEHQPAKTPKLTGAAFWSSVIHSLRSFCLRYPVRVPGA